MNSELHPTPKLNMFSKLSIQTNKQKTKQKTKKQKKKKTKQNKINKQKSILKQIVRETQKLH